MYIHSFSVENYKVHRGTKLGLYPITVLVGPNGGGKSALFDALMNFSMVSRGKLSEAFGPGPWSFEEVRSHGSYGAARIRYNVVMSEHAADDARLEYAISYGEVGSPGGANFVIYDETLTRADTGDPLFDRGRLDQSALRAVSPFVGDDRSVFAAIRRAQVTGDYEEVDPLVTHCAREVSRITKFRLDPTNLARPSPRPELTPGDPSRTTTPRLSYEGANLAGVLSYLAETASPAINRIIEQAQPVMPGLHEVVLNNVGNDRVGFGVRYSDARGIVTAANLSDGTLSLIGALTLLAADNPPAILCLEEPENGMTPSSTRVLYQAVQRARSSPHGPQVLISSHSPFVVYEAWNGDDQDFIYQVSANEGSSVIRRFVDIVNAHGIQLRKVDGSRQGLGLETANQVMDGYLS
jgi:predicted ATPase